MGNFYNFQHAIASGHSLVHDVLMGKYVCGTHMVKPDFPYICIMLYHQLIAVSHQSARTCQSKNIVNTIKKYHQFQVVVTYTISMFLSLQHQHG